MTNSKTVEKTYYKGDYDNLTEEKVHRIVEEFSVLDVKSIDQLKNIMAAYEGYEVLPIKRLIDQNTFHPVMIVLLFKRIDNTTANTFMIRVPLALTVDDSLADYEYEIKNLVIVKKPDHITKLIIGQR